LPELGYWTLDPCRTFSAKRRRSSSEQPHTRRGAFRARLFEEDKDMNTADFYHGTADIIGVALYLYPDGSLTNLRKAGIAIG